MKLVAQETQFMIMLLLRYCSLSEVFQKLGAKFKRSNYSANMPHVTYSLITILKYYLRTLIELQPMPMLLALVHSSYARAYYHASFLKEVMNMEFLLELKEETR